VRDVEDVLGADAELRADLRLETGAVDDEAVE